MREALRTLRGVLRSLRIYYGDRGRRAAMDRLYGEFVSEKILRPRCGAQEKASWAPKRPCGNEATFSLGFPIISMLCSPQNATPRA